MASDVQVEPNEFGDPSAALLDVARRAANPWLHRLAARSTASVEAEVPTDRIDAVAADLLVRLERLLVQDVEAQRTNPLSLFRDATARLTIEIAATGAPPAHRDRFALERFPDDMYALVPAGWDDIDPDLQAVGIAWGAWKAMTILRRRRSPPDTLGT